jgi:hypothetical protein
VTMDLLSAVHRPILVAGRGECRPPTYHPHPQPDVSERTGSPGRLGALTALEVILAVAYGAVVGSWLPALAAARLYELPAIVVASPPAAPPPQSALAAGESTGIHPAAWRGEAPSSSGSPPRDATADLLPPAPASMVDVFAAAAMVDGGRSAAAARRADPPRARADGCPAIVAEGEHVPARCRAGNPLPRGSDCPPARAGSGPILCIRAAD